MATTTPHTRSFTNAVNGDDEDSFDNEEDAVEKQRMLEETGKFSVEFVDLSFFPNRSKK